MNNHVALSGAGGSCVIISRERRNLRSWHDADRSSFADMSVDPDGMTFLMPFKREAIGWRIARPFWGNGYAPEAATAAIQFGFDILKLPEIIAITVPHNIKSRRVMEKLGMQYQQGGDFDHPLVQERHPLRRHVLYRLRRNEWAEKSCNQHPKL